MCRKSKVIHTAKDDHRYTQVHVLNGNTENVLKVATKSKVIHTAKDDHRYTQVHVLNGNTENVLKVATKSCRPILLTNHLLPNKDAN